MNVGTEIARLSTAYDMQCVVLPIRPLRGETYRDSRAGRTSIRPHAHSRTVLANLSFSAIKQPSEVPECRLVQAEEALDVTWADS